MSPPEVVHRVKEQIRRRSDRSLVLDTSASAGLGVLPFSQVEFDRIARDCVGEWQEEVDRARVGAWCFLGCTWSPVALNDLWHHDPISGETWEKDIYCFDVSYRHRHDRGDIKYTWEVNRLQILPIIAALYRAKARPEDRDFCLKIIESWIDSNPAFRGVNWSSGIEVALRIMSLSTAITLLGREKIPDLLQQKISATMQTHLFWLNRYPSKYSSANNHRIAELAATYILGRMMPELPRATELADRAFAQLESEALLQIHEDGVGAEQSPTYSCFTLEWYLLALNTAKNTGEALSPQVLRRFEASANHLRWMMDDAGNVPRIGDDDEGRVLLSGASRESDYVAGILASLSTAVDAQHCAPPTTRPHLRQLWIGLPSQANSTPVGAAFFDAGGYSVLRHEIQQMNSIIALDHGPLGYRSIAAHGHADALSVWWHLKGQPIFVDAGTYLYHSGGTERDKFRGTRAHNTLCVSSVNQSKISGAFNWARPARSQRVPMSKTTLGLCAVARHDGYQRRFGIVHERTLGLDAPHGYVIKDRIIGAPKACCKDIFLNYVLHPDISAQHNEAGQIHLFLQEAKLATISLKMREGDTLRNEGQPVAMCLEKVPYSPAFGVLETTLAIRAEIVPKDLAGGILETRIVIHGA